jgi:transcriptional regulator with XRE-family HTH domain
MRASGSDLVVVGAARPAVVAGERSVVVRGPLREPAAAAMGAEMRSLRLAAGLTQDQLARKVNYALTHVSGVETARTSCSSTFMRSVDRALGADGQLADMLDAVVVERARARHARAERRESAQRRSTATVDEDVRRRAFLGLGLAAVLCPEAAARALNEAEAEHVAYAWSRELFIVPDRQVLLPGLMTDLKRFMSQGGPQRGIALLSAYVAMIVASGGDMRTSDRWWGRARAAADASGDPTLASYVAGLHSDHVVLYFENTPAQALAVAEEALARTSTPCPGRMRALSTAARAHAVMGRQRAARKALATLERTFERLPRDVIRETISVAGWAEERLHHTRSYAAAYGGLAGGPGARGAALALYRPPAWRGPAQVRLHEAVTEGPAYAVAALAELTPAQRADRTIRLTAVRTLNACRTRGADVRELREAIRA